MDRNYKLWDGHAYSLINYIIIFTIWNQPGYVYSAYCVQSFRPNAVNII